MTNALGGAIIMTSKENKRKQEKNKSNKIKNHSIHSINKCYMKGMKSKRKGKVIPLGH